MTAQLVRREWAPLVDQHATWLALNPIQGCLKKCTYCFLNVRGQTSVTPVTLATPAKAVRQLLDSPFYGPARPVALYTWTDVMDVDSSRAHLHALLDQFHTHRLRNPTVVITKCHIPDETITAIARARAAGLPVIVYLSYSGLNRRIERGIRHDQLAGNFPRLAAAGIPIVHYWRPAFPASATTKVMTGVLELASRHATATVAAGLKVEPDALDHLTSVWPELASTDGVTDAEGVYPRAFWDFIHDTATTHPGHPVFHTNSCALAYVLRRPDTFGVHGGTVCQQRNHCPAEQRARCVAPRPRPPLTSSHVRTVLTRRGLGNAPFTVDRRQVLIHAPVSTAVAAALTQDLDATIDVIRSPEDRYWNSGTAGATPVIV